MSQNRHNTRTSIKSSSHDSPKNTVRVAQIEKSKELKEPDIKSLFSMSSESKSTDSDLKSFREEMRDMMSQLNDNITKSVSKTITSKIEILDEKFSSRFNELRTDIKGINAEVKDAKRNIEEVSGKVKDIEKSLEFQANQLKVSDDKQEENLKKIKLEIDSKLEELNKKILLMEKHGRKYNLLFYGFPEERAGDNIYENMRNVFIEDLHLDSDKVENMYFANAHRLASEYSDGPRPIIMRFTSFEERELVLANAHKLAGSRRRILPDLPVVMKKERGRLAKEAYQIRKNEKLHTRIRDKGLEVYLEVRKEKTDSWVKRHI